MNPSPYNIYMKVGGRTLIGSSPEELVKLEGRVCTTCPIAGTRPRGETPEADLANERELTMDEDYGKIENLAANHRENEKLETLVKKWRQEVHVEIRMKD